MLKKITIGIMIVVVGFLFIGGAGAIPQLINYQGKLTGPDNIPLTGYYDMYFYLYNVDSGGSPLWNETQSSVSVEAGFFNVLLGSDTVIPSEVFTFETVYLGVKVGSDAEMTPRQQIVSAGYAYNADMLDGHDSSYFAPATGGDYVLKAGDTMTGTLTFNTGSIEGTSTGTTLDIIPADGDYLRVGDERTANRGLNANDDLFVNGKLEVDGQSYFDSYINNNLGLFGGYVRVNDDITFRLGTNNDVMMEYNTADETVHTFKLGLPATSNNMVITEVGDLASDFKHAQQTNPTVFIHSTNQSTTEWVSLTHDQTDGEIQTGAGNLRIGNGADSHGLDSNGDLFVTGSFEVDGMAYFDSGVTVEGDVYATTYYGDGSNLTGIDVGLTQEAADNLYVNETGDTMNGVLTVETSSSYAVGARTTASGVARGAYGESTSTSGRGVEGKATSSSGFTYGGYFTAASTQGRGVMGSASETSASTENYGGYFTAYGGLGRGVYGQANNSDNVVNYGGYFEADGYQGRGVYGLAGSTSGIISYGGYFESRGLTGRGVYGLASRTGFTNYGGYFESYSTSGIGIYGFATAESGTNYGGYFRTDSVDGVGLLATSEGYGSGYQAKLATPTHAGYFKGDVTVEGDVYADAFYGDGSNLTGIDVGLTQEAADNLYVNEDGDSMTGPLTVETDSDYAINVSTESTAGTAVHGYASAASGTTYGIYGRTDSTDGHGVYGQYSAAGPWGYIGDSTYAVYGQNSGHWGFLGGGNTGVYGQSSNYAVGGYGTSPSAWAGHFSGGRGLYAEKIAVNDTSPQNYNTIGDATSGHGLLDADDLLIKGTLEVDGMAYFDSGVTVEGDVYATSYYGNGSNLSGIPSGADYVLKAGDTMTGTLTLESVDLSYAGAGPFTILPTGETYTRIGDAGTTGHALSANDDLFVSGKLEVDGTSYFDGATYLYGSIFLNNATTVNSFMKFNDDRSIYFGTGNDVQLEYDTGQNPDALILGIGADSNGFVICEQADLGFNFAHAQQTNPTVFIHSSNQSNTEWISLTHDQTDGEIQTGAGNLSIGNGADSHGLDSNGDLFVSGSLEVDGMAYFDNGITVEGDVYATTYYGDGSNLTGVLSGTNYVLKAGDKMTGTLTVETSGNIHAVWAIASAGNSGYGVSAEGGIVDGIGVYANGGSVDGIGVYGKGATGIYGYGTRTDKYGVYGRGNVEEVYGYLGSAIQRRGVYGHTDSGCGVYGEATDEAGVGVYGRANDFDVYGYLGGGTNNRYGIYGHTNTGAAGYFAASSGTGKGLVATNEGSGEYVELAKDNYGIYANAYHSGVTHYGGYFEVTGPTGIAIYGATSNSDVYGKLGDTNLKFGVYGRTYDGRGVAGEAASTEGWAGYFSGGEGVYASKLAVSDTTPQNYNTIGNATTNHTLNGAGDLLIADAFEVNGKVFFDNLGSGSGTALHVSATGEVIKYSSSRRFKKDIEELAVNHDKFMALRPVKFKWNEKTETPDVEDYGLIAEEIDEIAPELVSYDGEDQPFSVKYNKVNVMLLKVVQEQQKQIEKLNTKLAELEDKLGTALELIEDRAVDPDGKPVSMTQP